MPFLHKLKVEGLEFPLKACAVKKFENLNDTIAVYMFAYDEKTGVYPVYVTSARKRVHYLDFLLLTDGNFGNITVTTACTDFEAYTCKLQCPVNRHTATQPYELHKLSGSAYHVICAHPVRIYEPVVYRGPNVVNDFLARLKKESWVIHEILKDVEPMKLSEEERCSFRSADDCYLCKESLGADRTRDHCHLTG